MSRLEKVTGVVIKRVNLNDNDVIVTIFTKEKGKVQAVAKGARKNKSHFISCTQLFCYGNYVYYPGKKLAYLNQSELIKSFYELRNDLGRLQVAAYIVEVLNQSFQERQKDERVLNLLLHSLYLLNRNCTKDPSTVLLGFQLKFMGFMGYTPQLSSCANCSSKSGELFFSYKSGGVICERCVAEDTSCVKMSGEELNILKTLLHCDVKKLGQLQYDKNLVRYLVKIMNDYLSYYLDKRIYAYEFMEIISEPFK